jgi:glycosyltransferase involved in cell wall biosynthesis
VNIEYIAQYGTSGYATAAKGNMLYFLNQGHNLCFAPLKFDDSQIDREWLVDQRVCGNMTALSKYDAQIYHTIPNLWSMIRPKVKKNYYTKQIGYCTWETQRVAADWVTEINQLDELWVPSTFNHTYFAASGVTIPIVVFPHIFLEQTLPARDAVSLCDYRGRTIPNNKFTFYCIAEYVDRKGILDLLDTYSRFNETHRNTQLLLKLHYGNYSQASIKHVENAVKPYGDNVYLISKNVSNKELLEIHSLGDCYVSLHKGEGFGLSLYDAVNYGKKIIATNYGGPTDYLTENHCRIDYHMAGDWAYPDLGRAAKSMEILAA